MSSRRLAILRAQAAAAALTSATTQDTAYKARCAAFESGDHSLPTPPAPVPDTPTPVPAPETTDTWHSEPPPVPGVYIASVRRKTNVERHWDGKEWSKAGKQRYDVKAPKGVAVEWLRLVKADAAPVPTPTWRRGPDVPEAERTGLWHASGDPSAPHRQDRATSSPLFLRDCWYRAAAPGTQVGDPYDEAKYGSAA